MTTGIRSSESGLEQPRRSQIARWAYLIFFGFILLGPALNPEARPEDWAINLAVVAIGLPLYVVCEIRQWHRTAAVGLMLIAIIANFFGSTALSVLPIYAAAATAADRTSQRQIVLRLGTITMVTLTAFLFSPIPYPYRFFLLISVVMVWIVGLGVDDDMSMTAHADVLRAENRRIAHLSTMSERERIARDLHDLAGQALTAITLRSQIVQRIAETDPARAVVEAKAIEDTARQTLESVRATVSGWQQMSIPDELHVATETLEAAGVTVDATGEWRVDLAPSVETVVALALRESVTNVVRHAKATHVKLMLEAPNGGVRLRVSDDGKGFDGGEGSGLLGMRERISAAGGQLTIATGPGTTVTVDMPFGGRTP